MQKTADYISRNVPMKVTRQNDCETN